MKCNKIFSNTWLSMYQFIWVQCTTLNWLRYPSNLPYRLHKIHGNSCRGHFHDEDVIKKLLSGTDRMLLCSLITSNKPDQSNGKYIYCGIHGYTEGGNLLGTTRQHLSLSNSAWSSTLYVPSINALNRDYKFNLFAIHWSVKIIPKIEWILVVYYSFALSRISSVHYQYNKH